MATGKEVAEKKAAKQAAAKAKGAEGGAGAAPEAGEACRAAKCKQPVRAKGYCRKHFIAWRRGKIGEKHMYNICSKEGCRKPTVRGGRCAEHVKGAAPAAEAAPAAS